MLLCRTGYLHPGRGYRRTYRRPRNHYRGRMRSAEQLHEGPYHSAGRVIENIIIIRPDASQYGASGLLS